MDTEWSVYLIRTAAGNLYTGITTDVARRLAEHAAGSDRNKKNTKNKNKGARYLRGRGPLVLVYSRVIGTRSEASQLEYRIKRLTKARKELLVAGEAGGAPWFERLTNQGNVAR